MKRLTFGLAGILAIGLASVTTAYAQATINDCEKIQAADAYNQCLAKFGPTSKVKSVAPERPGDIKDSSAEAAAEAGPPKLSRSRSSSLKATRARGRRRGRVVRGHTGGRKRATFSVRRRKHR